jgi:non-ribosomal peptide synthase protein (TIGR01720 family)
VRLQLEDATPGEALKAVKEQLRRIPNRGVGYGLLRYLQSDATATQLQAQPQAEVIFNYLGQIDQVWSSDALFAPAPESSGAAHSPHGQRSYLLEINALVVGGQLRLDWTYSRNRHQQHTIEPLAQSFVKAMRALIAHCQSPESGGYTPSDFPNVELDPDELEKALAEMDLN